MAALIQDEIKEFTMWDIGRQIPANNIDFFASKYLDIDDTLLSHIRDEAERNSRRTNFKCILHWYRNTTENNKRLALCDKLRKAAKEDLVSQDALNVLQQPQKDYIKGNKYFNN